MRTLLLDIETNGLDWKKSDFKIHCICMKDVETGIAYEYEGGDGIIDHPNSPLNLINKYDIVVAHYGQFFDFPVLEYHLGRITAKKYDTKVLASLMFPEYKSHSLEEWGKRLGILKGEYAKTTDWQIFTDEMLQYCHQDVEVLESLWKHLMAQNYSESAIELETNIATIIQKQIELGVAFDEKQAEQMYVKLVGKREELSVGLRNLFKPWYQKISDFIPKKDSKDGYVAGVPLTKIELNTFNPGSGDQIANRLMTLYNWQPTKFTETGKPAMDGSVLSSLPYPEAKQLAEYADVKKIIGMLGEGDQAWLKLVKNGRLHGRVNTNGAVTGRMTHHSPNLAQVPSVGTFYGSESRSLFIASPGYVMVGVDASSLELRCLAHFMARYDNGEYVNKLLTGDIHKVNQEAAGLETRDQAKTFIYACVPLSTDVLTKRGWKKYNQLIIGEPILTYNQEKNIKEWKPLQEVVYYESAELMKLSHGKGFNVVTTPNHRWFVNRRTGRKKHYYVKEVRTTEELTTDCNVITNAFYVSDNVSKKENTLNSNKYGRDWVEYACNLTSDEVVSFVNGFNLADGYKTPYSWNWCQNKNEIADGLSVASFLASSNRVGFTDRNNTKNPMVVCYFTKRQHTSAQTMKREKLPAAPVFCIKTENDSFVMRQGNTITITGNTIYGAGDEKIGKIIGKGSREGHKIKTQFLQKTPALAKLREDVIRSAKKGYILGLDKRKLLIRSEHAALNTLLQSAGALIMKQALIIAYQKKPDLRLVLTVHDEFQVETKSEDAEETGKLLVECIKLAAEHFNFRCPLDGQYKIGINWKETH